MIKRLAFIFLFFEINVSFAQNLTAVQKIPDSISTSSSFIITTTISKGQIIDFIEFSQTIPKGFTANNVGSKSGDFEFDKNEVKIIWLSPPMGKIFTFSYTVKVPPGAFGKQIFAGKIIYVTTNNERKVLVLPTKKITMVKTETIENDRNQKSISVIPIQPKHILAKAVENNASSSISSKEGTMRSYGANNFLYDNGKPVSPGFYVIIGSFGNKENAGRFRTSNMTAKGNLSSKIIQNQFTKVYNIYLMKTDTKANADTERLKYSAKYPGVWILKLE